MCFVYSPQMCPTCRDMDPVTGKKDPKWLACKEGEDLGKSEENVKVNVTLH